MNGYRCTKYCASPNCTNECGRKMSDYDKAIVKREEIPVMWGYFCGEPATYCDAIKKHEEPE